MPVKCNLWGILETFQDGAQDRWWPAKRKTSWPHLEISIPGLFDVFLHYCQELQVSKDEVCVVFLQH